MGDEARLTLVTHLALESDMMATLEDLQTVDTVDAIGACIRIVGEDLA